ncbi:MAG: hypothetical protein AB1631_27225 [Acidobacteriota bacterium]
MIYLDAKGPAQELAHLISEISSRIFGELWACDIEWKVRQAIDDGSNQIAGISKETDPGKGKLTVDEVTRLEKLREALRGGWVLWEAVDRSGGQGVVREVPPDEWRNEVGTEEYRIRRYEDSTLGSKL